MTGTELKAIRHKLGLSARGLAMALQMGNHGSRTIRRWEAGTYPVPGPISVAVTLMAQ